MEIELAAVFFKVYLTVLDNNVCVCCPFGRKKQILIILQIILWNTSNSFALMFESYPSNILFLKFAASCATDDTLTTLTTVLPIAALDSILSSRSVVRRAWDRKLTCRWYSNPSSVFLQGTNITPAVQSKYSNCLVLFQVEFSAFAYLIWYNFTAKSFQFIHFTSFFNKFEMLEKSGKPKALSKL